MCGPEPTTLAEEELIKHIDERFTCKPCQVPLHFLEVKLTPSGLEHIYICPKCKTTSWCYQTQYTFQDQLKNMVKEILRNLY